MRKTLIANSAHLLPYYRGEKVSFMFFLLAVTELMSIVESQTAPYEVAVHSLHGGNYSNQYWDLEDYWATSQSDWLNMLPLVLTNSMIASNSSSLEQIGWHRTLPASSCNRLSHHSHHSELPHLIPRHPVGEQLRVCREGHLGRRLGVGAVGSDCCPNSNLISRSEHDYYCHVKP